MTTDAELESNAIQTVTRLLEALRIGDVRTYHALMSDSDQQYMTEESLGQSMAAMREQTGALLTFRVEGIVLHTAALHAAAHVTMEFEKLPLKTELYHLALEGSDWRLDFDFAELLGHED